MMLLFSDVRVGDICESKRPMYLRRLVLTLLCPVEFCFIASWTCVVDSVIVVVCSLCVLIYMCRFVLCVLCL